MGIWYRTGTVSVSNGSPTVTGVGTGFTSLVKPGDFFFGGSNNRPIEVLSVDSPTELTLAEDWPFTTLSDDPYVIAQGPKWGDASSLALLVAQAAASQVAIYGDSGEPSDSLGVDGSYYFRSDVPQYYVKESGSWVLKADIVGPPGAAAVITATSETSRGIGASGTMWFTVDAGLSFQIGMRVRVAATSSPTNYMEGYVSGYSSTTLSITMQYAKGSGVFTAWSIGAAGDVGSTGATGASTLGTSTSSLTIGTGPQALTTQAGLALAVGSRVRIANSTSNFMDGEISAYSGTSMTVSVNYIGGSGTYTSWNISVVGTQGPQGGPGLQGNNGPPNTLVIGTVTTGDPGSSAEASITGSSPSQTLNLTIPRGASGANGSILTATSTTSLTPATGDKTFTLVAVADFLVNQRVRAASNATADKWMSGKVKSWNAGTKALVITVDLIGSDVGSASDWNISVTGEKGDQGPAGGFGSLSADKGTLPVGDGTTYGALAIGSDGSLPLADSTATYGIAWTAIGALLAGGYWSSSDVASAATCDIGDATTPVVNITGTTKITSLGASTNKARVVKFAGSLTLAYNGTSLVLPGAADIITKAGDSGIFVSDGSGNWKCVAWTPIGFLPREKLTGNRTYYVRNDGSDTNTGLANTAGGAFKTLQRAIDVVFGTLDLGGNNVTIQAGGTAPQTFTGSIELTSPQVGKGTVTVLGDATTPANYTISTTGTCVTVIGAGSSLNIRGFKLTSSGGYCLNTNTGGRINFGKIEFGASGPAAYHMRFTNAGSIGLISGDDYSISGGGQGHIIGLQNGIGSFSGATVLITGTPAWSIAFITLQGAQCGLYSVTYSGAATGKRYDVTLNSVLNSYGAGTASTYFPGNSNGTTATGGVQG